MSLISEKFFVDDFNDNNRDTYRWLLLQTNEAEASEENHRLKVTVHSGSGWAQAGYVTKDQFKLNEHIVKVSVPSRDNLNEMTLQICRTQTTSSDPYGQDNWYRIQKTGDNSFRIQSKIGGVVTTLQTFTSSSQQLVIKIQDGVIRFYDDINLSNLRCEQDYAIKDAQNHNVYDLYVYVFTSSQKSSTDKTGTFDDFAISPVIVTLEHRADDYNCFHDSTKKGGRGVTIWGPVDLPSITHGSESAGYIFTLTEPKYYESGDFCNVTFRIHADGDSASDIGPITMKLWNKYPPPLGGWEIINATDYFISSVAEHRDATLTIDISQISGYNDTYQMFLTFKNDATVDIQIKELQIVRGYAMNSLVEQDAYSEDQTRDGTYDFATRHDYPCNFDKCGGMSYTGFTHDNHYFQQIVNGKQPVGAILEPGNTYSWHWTNPPATFPWFQGNTNYVAKSHCLFNFNNVSLCDDNGDAAENAATPDVPFQIRLNNGPWFTFYQPKNNHHLPHGIDLATHESLKYYYNDEPDAENTLDLLIPNNPDPEVNLFLADGETGLINLYRVYETKPCCLTINAGATGSGTISPSGGPFPIPEQGKTFDMTASGSGYLTDVKIDGTSKGPVDPYTVQQNDPAIDPNLGMEGHEIRAYFESPPVQYTITASYASGGSINPGTVTVNQGANQSFTITASNCYQIADVVIDTTTHLGAQSSPYIYTFQNVQNNHSITAIFSLGSQDHLPVILDVSGVAVTPPQVTFVVDGTTYSPGDLACLTTSGNHSFSVSPTTSDVYGEYTFAYWDVLDGGANHVRYEYCNPVSFNVTGSTQFLVATYTTTPTQLYTISASAGSNGSISPTTATVSAGGCATFNITPNSGYRISSLLFNGNSVLGDVVDNQYTADNITGNSTIDATFNLSQQYTITASAGANGSINPNGNVSVYHGDNQGFSISANSGYQIADVAVDSVSQGAISSYTFYNVQTSHSISATFASTTSNVTIKAVSMITGQTLPANLYVDSNCVGNGEVTVTLSNGNHTIGWDDYAWNEQYMVDAMLWEISDGLSNGETRNISQNTTITATYYP